MASRLEEMRDPRAGGRARVRTQSWDRLACWKNNRGQWAWSVGAGSCRTHAPQDDPHVPASMTFLLPVSKILSSIQGSSQIPTSLGNLSWQLQPGTRCSSVGEGHRKDMTVELKPSYPLPWPWNVHSTYHSHSGSCSKDTEKAKNSWDHLDSVCDWTQFRPLYKLFRFWQVGAEIYAAEQDKPCK